MASQQRPMFADVPDLAEWLGEDIPLDGGDVDNKRAKRCLRSASNLIRNYTGMSWLDINSQLISDIPEDLQDICLACAGRFYSNPDAETQWSRQIDDSMDGGGRKVEESGLYLTATERSTLDKVMSDKSPVIAGVGVIGSTRGEEASLDMHHSWFDPDSFLYVRLTDNE